MKNNPWYPSEDPTYKKNKKLFMHTKHASKKMLDRYICVNA